ncbi:unnamed protein product [Closterium sp. NIES-65]|nr:unnamed protein product [Closterium sp. NIES-65]
MPASSSSSVPPCKLARCQTATGCHPPHSLRLPRSSQPLPCRSAFGSFASMLSCTFPCVLLAPDLVACLRFPCSSNLTPLWLQRQQQQQPGAHWSSLLFSCLHPSTSASTGRQRQGAGRSSGSSVVSGRGEQWDDARPGLALLTTAADLLDYCWEGALLTTAAS